jgi:uncharacterized membrane protein
MTLTKQGLLVVALSLSLNSDESAMTVLKPKIGPVVIVFGSHRHAFPGVQ